MKREATRTRGSARGVFRILPFTNPSGAPVFRVGGTTLDGRRIRENFPEHAQAVARLQALEIESANLESAARPKVTRLTSDQIAAAESAFTRLEGKSLLDAVDFYLTNYREPVRRLAVETAFDEFLTERIASNLRPRSIASLKEKCGELVRDYPRRSVAEITGDTLRKIINKPTRSPRSRDGYRRALSAFFTWATRKGYVATNPAKQIAPVKLERHEPAILTPEQVTELLQAAQGHKGGILVPYVALGVFAALRPTELARIDWSRIDLKAGTVTLNASMAKMRGRRIVELSKNCVEWLKPFAADALPIVDKNFRRDFDAVKVAAGWGGRTDETEGKLRPWTQDIMRHTGISMHLAEHEHEGRTATWAGNSPDIIQRHYKGLVKRDDAKKFWSIAPPSTKQPRNVIELKARAA